MKWLTGLIPSPTVIAGAITALLAGLFAWGRRDARRDAEKDIENKDLHHAQDIENRVARDRADPDRLRPFDDAGYRD